MKKSTIILLASARKNSDTLRIVEEIFSTKKTTCIDLLEKKIAPYNYEHIYPEDDQFMDTVLRCLEFENIIFATPVYWYSMSGVLKIFFDRLTDVTRKEKTIGRKFAGKSVAVISLGTDPGIPPGFDIPFQSTAEYFDMKFLGSIYCCTKNIGRMDLNSEKVNEFLKVIEIE